jgi:CRP/FNR family cyclic AMP-dependent transcriptional regulator
VLTISNRTSPVFVASQPWLDRLPHTLRTRVINEVFSIKGDKGDVLLRAGEPVMGWYAVLSGLVKLQTHSPDGRLSVFLGVSAGDWFGEGSALKSEKRRYEVVALRDTALLCLPLPLFDELRAASLAFNQALVAQMNKRLSQSMAVIEAGRVRSPQQRVALYLSRLFWHGMKRIELSQEELGHLAGLSRQTVNKVLQRMQLDGLVAINFGRITILDEPALAALLTTADSD